MLSESCSAISRTSHCSGGSGRAVPPGFLDAVLGQVPVGASSPAVADIVTDLVRYAERQIAPQRLILVIDDAHELAKEVFDLIAQMMAQLRPNSFHVCFLGERQLLGILDRTINLAGVRQFEFEPFTTEDLSNYVQHKLVAAGYKGELPVSVAKPAGSMLRPAAYPAL